MRQLIAVKCSVNPPTLRRMGGANLHTPQSVFRHMMGQQNSPQQNGGPWLQMSQVPALSMPWSIPALQQPDLIRFTGERSQPAYGVTSLHHKRKLSTPDITDIRKVKQFISEEKMASHFQGLRISSNYHDSNPSPSTSTACPNQLVSDNSRYMNSSMESTETVDIDQNGCREPRLVISEELRRMQEEPLIPVSLLSKLERPSMALVLWEPPSKHLVRVLPTPRETSTPFPNVFEDNNNNGSNNNNSSSSSSSSNNNRNSGIGPNTNRNTNNNNNNNNNNNSGIIDLNHSSSTQLEPMEL